ncbi:MAG: diguanylate cyclase [Acidimicrobiia bacterium]|nr:diguanylate cyclase [Acidimicrobiia bacterium]
MTDPRAFVSVAVGFTGLALGVLAAVGDDPLLGVFAGVAALGAGLIGWVVARQVRDTERQLALERRQMLEMEEAVTSQVQARLSAEETVRSLSAELSATQESEVERTHRIEAQIKEEVQAQGASRNSIVDEETGLYNDMYFRAAVKARVAAARRHLRPVAVVLVQVVELDQDKHELADAKTVADYLVSTLRDSDTACRTSGGLFALVLEDTPENGAVWTIERLRRRFAEDFDNMTVWAGIACYPAHAFEVRDLMGKASEALEAATEWRQDRIEVAVAD